MGDFYELLFNDAKIMSPVLQLKLTARGTGKNRYDLAGVPVKALDGYLKKSVDAGYTCAIVEQGSEQMKIKGSMVFSRHITRIVSPGTIIIPELLDNRRNNYLMAISPGKGKIRTGIAYIDVSTGEFIVSEVSSNSDQELLDEIYRLRPTECIVPGKCEKKIASLVKKTSDSLIVKGISDSWFLYETAFNELISFFKVNSLDGFGVGSLTEGIKAAGSCLAHVRSLHLSLANVHRLIPCRTHDYLFIDAVAQRNLELDRNLRDGSRVNTLLEILDKDISTSMGSRLLYRWLQRPLLNVKEINLRLDAVGELQTDLLRQQEIIETLSKIIDLERTITKISYGTAHARDLLALSRSLQLIPRISSLLEEYKSPLLVDLRKRLHNLTETVELIASAIREDAAPLPQDGQVIKEGFDEKLDEWRNVSHQGKKWLTELENREQRRIEKLAKEKGKKSSKLKIGYTDGYGYFLETSSNALVPDDYRILRSLKTRIRWINDELEKIASKVLNADDEVLKLEKELFSSVIEVIKQDLPIIQVNANVIATIDVLVGFSTAASRNRYAKPTVDDNSVLQIVKGRHPVVERILPPGKFVANDLNLDATKDRLLVVTGANMGGKSTYLRQTALIVILAQMGSFVPAEGAHIGVIDRIFTRVGVVDDITRNQSHFMVEMNETANILNNATSRSLILLDEIGRGTSTSTGLAIAWAVSKYVHDEVGAKTLFATHFHQLNHLEDQFEGIRNFHVAVDRKKNELIFLHKILPGGTNESYGIEVALLAGLPHEVIEDARRIRDNLEVESSKIRKRRRKPKKIVNFLPDSTKEDETISMVSAQTPDPTLSIVEKAIVRQVKELNLNELTPIETMNLLGKLQKALKTKRILLNENGEKNGEENE